MLINLRNALMAGRRLPYDAEVEFLESTGTQWIDTGLLGRDGYDFEYSFRPLTPLPCGIGGEYESNKNCYIGLVRNNGNLAYNYSNPNIIVEVQSLTLGTDYNIKAHLYSGEQYFEVNGVRRGIGSRTGSFVSSFSLYVFAINSNNRPTSNANMRLYSLKIYLNGTLVRDFIPVRKGTVGYLYDRVSGKLFGNAGTGDFVLGQDVVPVEYIESHGTEYIDTGVNGSQNLRTTFDYQLVYSGTAPVAKGLFGYYSNGAKYHLYCSGAVPTFFQVGMGNAYANTLYVDNVRHSIEYNNSAVSIDGNVVATFAPYEYPTARTLLLFALRNASGGLYSMTPMRKWRVQMWDNGTPVRDYVPVRVGTEATSWEGAMMDVLTRRIYRNAGTGAFTYGNDLKYPIPAE